MTDDCCDCKFYVPDKTWDQVHKKYIYAKYGECNANPPQQRAKFEGKIEWIRPEVGPYDVACRFFQPQEPTTADNDTKTEMNQTTNSKEEN